MLLCVYIHSRTHVTWSNKWETRSNIHLAVLAELYGTLQELLIVAVHVYTQATTGRIQGTPIVTSPPHP